jgi:hypothetical protein
MQDLHRRKSPPQITAAIQLLWNASSCKENSWMVSEESCSPKQASDLAVQIM